MEDEPSYHGGDEMAEVIAAGVEAIKAAIAECRSVLDSSLSGPSAMPKIPTLLMCKTAGSYCAMQSRSLMEEK
jgi:hypothetical protein